DPIGGADGEKLFFAATLALSREREGAIFDEASLVAKIGDVLACHALPRLAATRDRLGPGLVVKPGITLSHRLEIGPNVIGIGRLLLDLGAGTGFARLHEKKCLSLEQIVARMGRDQTDDASRFRR